MSSGSPPVAPSARSISSAAWLFPIKGMYYFAKHRFLWPLLRARLVPCMLLSFIVLFSLFIGTFLPQVAVLKLFGHGHGAWVNAAFLVLGEGAAITALLFEAFLVDDTQARIFDSILLHEGHEDLVATLRPTEAADADADDPVARLGKPHKSAPYAPFSFRQIAEFIVFLPLNLIPWIGVPLFLWLTGYRAGPLQHHRYFVMRRLRRADRNAFVKANRLGYTAFGCVALVLQLVPVLSMLFLMTTAAGSALWVSQIEDIRKLHAGAANPGDDPPPYEYTDDPI